MCNIIGNTTRIAALALALAFGLGLTATGWAADPVAIWDGDLSVTQQGYTLNLNGNSLSSDNSIITIDQSVGITVESSSTFSGGFTVLFKYSNLNVALAAKQVLATTTLTDAEARTGVTIGTSGLSCGIWAGSSWNSSGTFNSMNISNQTAGVLGYTHYSSSNYSGGTGTRLFYLKNGVATTILNAGTLGSNNDISKYKGFSIGGLKTTVSGFSAATGMKISGIAVFQGVLSESELKAYVWPSAKVGGVASGAAKYTDWDYADDMVTWALDSTGELASGTAKFGLFDTHAGSIPLTFVGNANAVFYPNAGGKAEAFWHKLSNGSVSGTYKAPGMALRFSGSAAGKSIGGTYGPVTIGGMYVESGASGYSLTQAGNVKRTTILGNPYDPDGVTNSVFRFEEPFTIARTGVLCLSGAINIVLPESSDTLTLNKTADNGNVAYAPQIVQKVTGLSNDGIITIGTHTTPGGTLKMHGEGTIEAVQLTASGATLDFSDLGSRANTTPFINCPLVVDANTVFVFPAGATFPYKVATAISGTAPTTDTVYTDANGNVFTGPISIDTENGTVTFDPLSASTIEVNGALTISGETAANINIPAGKTLTLASGAALTGTVTGSGTVVCNQVDLSGAGFDNASGWTGKVQIAGDASMPTTYFDESSYGNANSTLEIASGHVAITAATALPGTVNVASGATLYMTSSSIASLSISGTNSGTVNLQMASSLTTLTLGDGIARGAVAYPSSLTTLNVSLTETVADDGVKSFTVAGATPTGGTLTLTRADGTTTNVTGTVDGSAVSFAWIPAVSGKACWIDYEMDYESGVKTGFENSGSDTTDLHSDSGITGDSAFYNGMLYTYAHPWRDMTGANAYPSSWTAVVRCTVPNYENAAIITFGTCAGGLIGLVAGHDPETEMKLVKTTGNSAFTVLQTMTVQNATTAQHVYVFEVENNSTIKVYCDGEQVLNETYSTFTLGGGIQVGSVHGGVGSTGIIRFAKGENPANTLSETVQKDARIDCVRLYKGLLGPNAIRQLSVEFPAVKLYRATIAADATTTWDALTWSPAWDGGNAYSKIILTAAGDGTLTLPESITAEDFKIDVASGHVLTLNRAAGGTTITTTNPMEVDNGTIYLADDSTLGGWEIGGTGNVRLKNGATITGALSGTAKVEIPSGTTVAVIGGSIANMITGAGVIDCSNNSGLPGAFTFGAWTGTVKLPAIGTDVEVNFNNWGVTGSKVEVANMTAGWLANAEVLPELVLVSGMTLNYFSASFANTIDKLSGVGTFSLAADGTAEGYADGYFLVKDISDFTGSISVAAPGLAIGSAKPASPTTYGQIVLTTTATIPASKTWTASNGIVLGSSDATLTNTDGALDPAPTTSFAGGVVKATTSGGSTVYSVVDNSAATWIGGETGNWNDPTKWSTGVVPGRNTAVTFPAGTYTVGLSYNNGDIADECASLTLNGDVTLNRAVANTWAQVCMYGNVSGTGTLTLSDVGVKNVSGSAITVANDIVVASSSGKDSFFSLGTITINGNVTVQSGEFKSENAHLSINGLVTLNDGVDVRAQNGTASVTFNGGIAVPANASAALTAQPANTPGTNVVACTVTLGAGATFTYPTAETTVSSGASFTTSATDCYVKSTVSGSTTVYSVVAKPSVGNVAFAYGENYGTATVTATVSDTTATYKLTVGGTDYTGTVSGTTVTFTGVVTGHSSVYDSVGYAISATDSGSEAVPLVGDTTGSALIADSAPWVNENAGTTGTAAAGGSWATTVTYENNVAAVSDNTFTAVNCSTGDLVTVTVENVVYTELSDMDVSGLAADSQGAFCLGTNIVNDAVVTNFMILAKENNAFVWKPAAWSGTPAFNTPYNVEFTFDYAHGKYSVKINGTALSVNGDTAFDLCTAKTEVKNIDFKGSGTLSSIQGTGYSGYMVKDGAGNWYATIEAAVQNYSAANGPYVVLHSYSAASVPSGWKVETIDGVMVLKRDIKGVMILTY